MLGGTHKRIGIAMSLAILHPTTVPACLGAMAAGSIGGDICDVDILFRNNRAKDEDPDRDDYYDGAWEDAASNVLLLILFVLVDSFFGNGAVDWFKHNFGVKTMAAMAVFSLIIVCGMTASHRSYMHSILVGVILSGCLYIISAPLAPAFGIGFATHILLDLFNKTKMPILWPMKKRFSLNLCSADKVANAVLESVGEALCCTLGAYYLIIAILNYDQETKVLGLLNAPFSEGVSNLGAWLIVINIITFILENINFSMWLKGKWPYQNHDESFNAEKDNITMSFIQRNMYFLFVLGGALGGLLGYVVISLRGKKYIKNGALGIVLSGVGATCVVIEWACIYLSITHMDQCYVWVNRNLAGINGIYLLIYLAAMGIMAFIVYTNDSERSKQLTVKKVVELFIAIGGGALGGLLSINLKGYCGTHLLFKNTVMKMLQAQCLIITLIFIFLRMGNNLNSTNFPLILP